MKRVLLYTTGCLITALALYYFIPEKRLTAGQKIDKLIAYKNKHVLEAYHGDTLIKVYKIAIGRNSGNKQYEGDKRTPEGSYVINGKNEHSGYYKNLGISYPNKKDLERTKRENVKPGGDIKIHGLKNGLGFIGKFHRFMDWTAGCIALTNEEVDELYAHVKTGTPIVINP